MTERGTLLGGRYKLEQVIGRGGMAEVWRARDLRLERDVAVKRLRVDLASDPTFQARFRREAQSAAGLNHPNIVAVYDTGEELDTKSDVSVPYIVMELVEGVTLREVLRDGRKILPERALQFTAGVLDALAYSHRAGIIHRDIKPANVMLTPGGTVKVMDFGIARAVADTSATMTQTAAVIGTAQYLSPEQARGEKVDNRSDIYAVGCLLYELLTSQPLFKGDSPVSVAYQHVRETPVPPSQVDDEVTPEMDAIVLKSLEKEPRQRYQDAFEMREDIQRALRGEPVLALQAAGEQPTQVIPNDPMTTTARRAATAPPPAVAAAPQASSVPPSAPSPVEVIDEPEERRSRAGMIALWVITGLVLLAIGITAFILMNPDEPPPAETATVPAVVGYNQIAAEEAIRAEGLNPVVNPVQSADVPSGEVVEQNPAAATEVEPGSDVTIDVSQGPEMKTIPEGLTGVPVETAQQILELAGFTNVTVEDDNPETEDVNATKGHVTKTNPAAGANVDPAEAVTLTVATGQSQIPALRNLTLEEAMQAAQEAGFTLDATIEQTSEVTPGTVFDQTPSPGTTVDRGETIEVKVAEAMPEPSPTPSPSETPEVSESPDPEPTPTVTPTLAPDPDPSDDPSDGDPPDASIGPPETSPTP